MAVAGKESVNKKCGVRELLLLFLTHPLHELFPILINDTLREPNLAKADILIHLLRVFCVKRTPTAAHLEEQHPKGPEVDELRVAMFVEEDFRGEVLRRPTERVRELVRPEIGFRQPEITERDVARRVQKDVLWFQVPVQRKTRVSRAHATTMVVKTDR